MQVWGEEDAGSLTLGLGRTTWSQGVQAAVDEAGPAALKRSWMQRKHLKPALEESVVDLNSWDR